MEHRTVVRDFTYTAVALPELTLALQRSNIPFLDIAEKDIKLSVQINIVAATAFAQEAVRWFTSPVTGEGEAGGTLLITGATSAWRGSHSFGAFAAGKHGLRAISQVS